MAAVERLLSNISKDSTMPVLKEKLSYFDDNNGGLSTIIELINRNLYPVVSKDSLLKIFKDRRKGADNSGINIYQ